MAQYGLLPATGANPSLLVYLFVALVLLIVGLSTLAYNKIRG